MSVLSSIASLFKKRNKKSIPELVESLVIGDTVSLRFRDPKKMGYLKPEDMYSRFDKEDLVTMKVMGQITNNKYDSVLRERIIELTSIKTNGLRRSYIFLQSEVEEIENFRSS